MPVTFTGKPLVVGERDRTITFTSLGFDWAGNGYTLWLNIVAPDTTSTTVSLAAVGGHTDQGYLSSTAGLFDQNGVYTLKILARKNGFDRPLASVNYMNYVYP